MSLRATFALCAAFGLLALVIPAADASLSLRHHAHRSRLAAKTNKQVELQFHNIGITFDPSCDASAAWCALACPIINARTEDHKFNYFTATIQRLHLEVASCFILPKANFDYFMSGRFRVIARGQFMNNATPLPTRIANVAGQPVALVGGHAMAPLTEFYAYISGKGVKMLPVGDYWNKHYCSNFPIQMAAALKARNATRVNALMTHASSCTSIRVWGELERAADQQAEKSEIIKSSIELAGKVLPLVLSASNVITPGVAEAIDLTVDIMVKTAVVMGELSKMGGGGSNGARDIVVAVCRSYRSPLEMALRFGEDNPGFLAVNTIPNQPGGARTMLANAQRPAPSGPAASNPPAASSPAGARPSTARTAAA